LANCVLHRSGSLPFAPEATIESGFPHDTCGESCKHHHDNKIEQDGPKKGNWSLPRTDPFVLKIADCSRQLNSPRRAIEEKRFWRTANVRFGHKRPSHGVRAMSASPRQRPNRCTAPSDALGKQQTHGPLLPRKRPNHCVAQRHESAGMVTAASGVSI